jgi:polysaccharide export outer membrane protein
LPDFDELSRAVGDLICDFPVVCRLGSVLRMSPIYDQLFGNHSPRRRCKPQRGEVKLASSEADNSMNMKIVRFISARQGEGPCRSTAVGLFLVLSIIATGCGEKFWDPTQVGRFRPVPAVNVILDSLGVAEETPAAWETGEEPSPIDVVAYETDYVFGPGDIVTINIFELFNQGAMFTNQYVITETGKLSIPDVGVVEAAGLTESQLEDEIKQILSPNILKEPTVNVTLARSQSRLYSILGNGVPRPGRYEIPRYDYRLADALATAGGINQFNISYIYVSRPITGEEALAEPGAIPPAETPKAGVEKPAPVKEPPEELLEVIAPVAKRGHTAGGELVVVSAEMATDEELAEAASPEQLWPAANQNGSTRASTELSRMSSPSRAQSSNTQGAVGNTPSEAEGEGRIEWIFQDGRWMPVQIGQPKPAEKPKAGVEPPRAPDLSGLARKEPTMLGWNQIGPGGAQRRVIRIPAEKLLSGDPRYNIVIRPSDNIHVPVDIIGEFCIMGNVNSQGFINITGRPMTLKMAIAAAGGLGPLAWPKRCEVVRRIAKKREEIVMVDLDKIAMGEQPDFFIKPNDLINVGTHPTARWRAVLRNAFRATYGFGFVYDRNFADRDYGTGRPFDFLF